MQPADAGADNARSSWGLGFIAWIRSCRQRPGEQGLAGGGDCWQPLLRSCAMQGRTEERTQHFLGARESFFATGVLIMQAGRRLAGWGGMIAQHYPERSQGNHKQMCLRCSSRDLKKPANRGSLILISKAGGGKGQLCSARRRWRESRWKPS